MIIYRKDDTPIYESTKLTAIEYFQTTWIKLDNGEFQRLSNRKASRRLMISCKMLCSWVLNKEKIQKQRKGSCCSREPWQTVKEVKMEQELNQRFEAAWEQGRKVTFKWILRHSRDIYSNLHLHCVIIGEDVKKKYLGFRFSPAWFRGFRKRYCISLRCGTKRAQKALDEPLPVI